MSKYGFGTKVKTPKRWGVHTPLAGSLSKNKFKRLEAFQKANKEAVKKAQDEFKSEEHPTYLK